MKLNKAVIKTDKQTKTLQRHLHQCNMRAGEYLPCSPILEMDNSRGAFWMFLEGSASRIPLVYSNGLDNVPFCCHYLLHYLTLLALSLLFLGITFEIKYLYHRMVFQPVPLGSPKSESACNSDIKILNTVHMHICI